MPDIKFNEQAKKMMKDPEVRAVMLEMTPERTKRMADISNEIYDLLKQKTEGPLEGHIILQTVLEFFEKHYGPIGVVEIGRETEGKSGGMAS